jgi:hypothetical protein
MEFTSAFTSLSAGSCSTSIRPLANFTSAFCTPGSASSAFSIFGTQEGQESSSLRRVVRITVLVMVGSFRVIVVASEQDIDAQSTHRDWRKRKGIFA